MDKIIIYTADGSQAIYEAPIGRDSKEVCRLMGEHYVELRFKHKTMLPFKRGCYITYLDSVYTLKKDAAPEALSSADGYQYTLQFYARQHLMEHRIFRWLTGMNNEVTFHLTTTLEEYANLLVANMNAYMFGVLWTHGPIPEGVASQTKALSFDGISCWDALSSIATEFGVEWWVTETSHLGRPTIKLNFGKCAIGDYAEVREGEVVKRFPPARRGDDANFGTRFYVFGGTKNLPDDYLDNTTGGTTNHISEKRLHLPNGLEYIDAVEGLSGSQIIEKTIILDDIFPKNTEYVSEVRTVKREIIEGEKQGTAYVVVCDNTAFHPAGMKIGTLGVTFTSGALNGRYFDVSITDTKLGETFDKQFEIIAQVEGEDGSSQIIIPNEYLKPAVGDSFILTGVKLPDEKVRSAENELLDAGTAMAHEYYADTNVYDCTTNPVYCHKADVDFALGQKVSLIGAQFGEEGRQSRVQGYEKLLYDRYQATYSVGDNTLYSRSLKLAKELNNATLSEVKAQKREDRSDFYQIKLQSAGALDVIPQVNTLIGNDKYSSAREIAEDVVEVNVLPTLNAHEAKLNEHTEIVIALNDLYNSVEDVATEAKEIAQSNTKDISDIKSDYLRKDDTADFATDLTGVPEATHEEFTYRTSAGRKSIRDKSAVIRKIKGNTVVFNQLVDNGDFSEGTLKFTGVNTTLSNNSDGSINALNKGSSGSCGIAHDLTSTIPSGHKVLVSIDYKRSSSTSSNCLFYLRRKNVGGFDQVVIGGIKSTQRRVDSAIITTTDECYAIFVYPFLSGEDGSSTTIYSLMAIDLTVMFGIGNEPKTADEFRTLYPDSYYQYCEPKIRGVRVNGIKTVGFNLFNKNSAEGGYLDGVNGNIVSSSIKSVSDFIRVLPNTQYYLKDVYNGYYNHTYALYDSYFNLIGCYAIGGAGVNQPYNVSGPVTTPLNAKYMRVVVSNEFIDSCNVNFRHSRVRDGEHSNYEEHFRHIPEIAKYFPYGMHCINNVYDEINDAFAIQRIGIRDYEDGDENDVNVITDGLSTIHVLSKPISDTLAEPIQLDYWIDDWGTEEAISSDVEAPTPFKADIVYQFNAEGRIRDNARNIERLEKQVDILYYGKNEDGSIANIVADAITEEAERIDATYAKQSDIASLEDYTNAQLKTKLDKSGLLAANQVEDLDISTKGIAKELPVLSSKVRSLSPNVMAGIRTDEFFIEKSVDGGNTWSQVLHDTPQIRGMFVENGFNSGFQLSPTEDWALGSKFRITIYPKIPRNVWVDYFAITMYANARHFNISGEYCARNDGGELDWQPFNSSYRVNDNQVCILAYKNYFAFQAFSRWGIRFTFEIAMEYASFSRVVRIEAYGSKVCEIAATTDNAIWTIGKDYLPDVDKNVTFPEKVIARSFEDRDGNEVMLAKEIPTEVATAVQKDVGESTNYLRILPNVMYEITNPISGEFIMPRLVVGDDKYDNVWMIRILTAMPDLTINFGNLSVRTTGGYIDITTTCCLELYLRKGSDGVYYCDWKTYR